MINTLCNKNLETLASHSVFKQVISDLIHVSENLVMNSGVHASFHQNFHHRIIHVKFKLKIFHQSSYERVVWHYEDANIDLALYIPI